MSKSGNIDQAPTPQNTPASAAGSYMPKGGASLSIPSTISEKSELLKGMLANNPALLESIQAKLGQLVGTDSGYFESLPKATKNNVYALKNLQKKQHDIEAQFQSELLELERKFQTLYEPVYKVRRQIVLGEVEPTAEEIESGKKAIEEAQEDFDEEEDDDDDEDDEEEQDQDAVEKGVPAFWLTAMQTLPPIADMISDRDVEVLESLVDIRLEYLDSPGFKLVFEFAENEFFSNKQLTKTYYYQKELGYTGEFIYDHAEGDDIKWSDNEHNVTVSIELRKQRNKHTKQVRTIEKTTPTFSFFNFFTPPQMPDTEGEDGEFEDIDEELEESLQNDYSVGELIKEKLLPRAVDWFTGQALAYEPEFAQEGEEELDEEDYDEDDEDEEGDDDSDDDDGDDDDEPAAEKPECKQQWIISSTF